MLYWTAKSLTLRRHMRCRRRNSPRTSISSGELSSLMSPSSPRHRDRAERVISGRGMEATRSRNEGHMAPFSLMDWAALRPWSRVSRSAHSASASSGAEDGDTAAFSRWGKSPSRSGKSDRRKPLCADHVRTSSNRVCAALTASASRNGKRPRLTLRPASDTHKPGKMLQHLAEFKSLYRTAIHANSLPPGAASRAGG